MTGPFNLGDISQYADVPITPEFNHKIDITGLLMSQKLVNGVYQHFLELTDSQAEHLLTTLNYSLGFPYREFTSDDK